MPHTDVNFVKALGWANEKHKEDYRKGTDIPYFSHLMSVCALVMENGGNAEECIAALLHDVVEDLTLMLSERTSLKNLVRGWLR